MVVLGGQVGREALNGPFEWSIPLTEAGAGWFRDRRNPDPRSFGERVRLGRDDDPVVDDAFEFHGKRLGRVG
jgi:hypothetical protein